jgi:hypothetical protein
MPELTTKGLVQPQVGAQLPIWSAVASCPSKNTTGSPTYWNSMNAIKATLTMTITACASRLRMNANIVFRIKEGAHLHRL